jgi:hypothetical protein
MGASIAVNFTGIGLNANGRMLFQVGAKSNAYGVRKEANGFDNYGTNAHKPPLE